MEDFEDFVERLREISEQGYIETHRAGNTGIGKTLEDLLGIDENNIPGPDAVGVELKSTRRDSHNLTTLFTKEPPKDERPFWGTKMVKELGYVDDKGREALKVTIRPSTPNSRGFSLDYDNTSVSVVHEEVGVCATYPLDYLQERFEEKFPALVMVLADTKKVDGREYFWYNEAYLLDGFDGDAFLRLMRDGEITLDLRMHLKESGANRNRGTAWRIMDDSRLDEAFEERIPLLGEQDASEIDSPDPSPSVPPGQETLDDV
ncbi:MvaI/BcnI family restriction endonuclease [Haloplanus sp. C73]|uniref:MvaI/BcnI family restriction endonuclease n=1 Tax=Haloplanus sp. C73 TaxID=3421641 RepID=UPI003EBE3253